ncbi:MAG: PAS domain-containing protein [Dokdonella sp.]|uniref:PAS domain-containing protein n=1 Tax=Dokdonella sp. TaxID=2291710 RepID=UPI002CB586BD|nr:PAS domain-containing protein [Dokdonella sp.]HOX70349.1 PAS domain-containing protein [Dokdonella sp.]HPG94248.1 PAS domain-containing protein [Dokdonella sp.]HPN79313.1 PAS domain-containing protein [Dokdonella sp.]
MTQNPHSLESPTDPIRGPADAADDVWTQLAEFVSRPDTDPVLRLLVNEATAVHRNLRGVTATIANRYRALIDAAPDAITLHDENGRVLDANATACKLFGQDRDSLLACSMQSLIPDLDSAITGALAAAFDSNGILTCRSRIRRVDGSHSNVEVHAHSYLDAQNQRIIAVTRDLAARESAHDQLCRSEAELRQTLRDMDTGVVVRNRKGHIVSCNPAACRILQISEPDMLALRTDQLAQWCFVDATGADLATEALPWARAMKTGKAVESAVCGVHSPTLNGMRWLSITSVPRFGDNAVEADEVVSVFADITPIKQDATLFSHAQSLINLGAWQLMPGGERMLWSAQMHAIFDVPPSIPASRERLLNHFSGMDQRRLRQALDTARTEEATEITARITTAIGRRRQVRIRLRALDQGSAAGGIIGCVQDITTEVGHDGAATPD